jgi:hypothetical protein
LKQRRAPYISVPIAICALTVAFTSTLTDAL